MGNQAVRWRLTNLETLQNAHEREHGEHVGMRNRRRAAHDAAKSCKAIRKLLPLRRPLPLVLCATLMLVAALLPYTGRADAQGAPNGAREGEEGAKMRSDKTTRADGASGLAPTGVIADLQFVVDIDPKRMDHTVGILADAAAERHAGLSGSSLEHMYPDAHKVLMTALMPRFSVCMHEVFAVANGLDMEDYWDIDQDVYGPVHLRSVVGAVGPGVHIVPSCESYGMRTRVTDMAREAVFERHADLVHSPDRTLVIDPFKVADYSFFHQRLACRTPAEPLHSVDIEGYMESISGSEAMLTTTLLVSRMHGTLSLPLFDSAMSQSYRRMMIRMTDNMESTVRYQFESPPLFSSGLRVLDGMRDVLVGTGLLLDDCVLLGASERQCTADIGNIVRSCRESSGACQVDALKKYVRWSFECDGEEEGDEEAGGQLGDRGAEGEDGEHVADDVHGGAVDEDCVGRDCSGMEAMEAMECAHDENGKCSRPPPSSACQRRKARLERSLEAFVWNYNSFEASRWVPQGRMLHIANVTIVSDVSDSTIVAIGSDVTVDHVTFDRSAGSFGSLVRLHGGSLVMEEVAGFGIVAVSGAVVYSVGGDVHITDSVFATTGMADSVGGLATMVQGGEFHAMNVSLHPFGTDIGGLRIDASVLDSAKRITETWIPQVYKTVVRGRDIDVDVMATAKTVTERGRRGYGWGSQGRPGGKPKGGRDGRGRSAVQREVRGPAYPCVASGWHQKDSRGPYLRASNVGLMPYHGTCSLSCPNDGDLLVGGLACIRASVASTVSQLMEEDVLAPLGVASVEKYGGSCRKPINGSGSRFESCSTIMDV